MNEVIKPGQFHSICQVVVNGRIPVHNQANLNLISSWVAEDQGEVASAEWFKKVLAEHPRYAAALVWESADVLDPKKREQAKAAQTELDRQTFNTWARQKGYSEVEANFRLACSVLGPSFVSYDLTQAVASNALQLAQASETELKERSRKYQEQRTDFLLNLATDSELREAARTEMAQRRIQAQREEQERQFAHREKLDSEQCFPPIPETNQYGERLDAAYFNKISNSNIQLFKSFIRKHGAANVTARLRGIR